jgi:hypothetical protein
MCQQQVNVKASGLPTISSGAVKSTAESAKVTVVVADAVL